MDVDGREREPQARRHGGTENAEMIERGRTLSADYAEKRRWKTANGREWTRKITTDTDTEERRTEERG
jgi:hypothetical protein